MAGVDPSLARQDVRYEPPDRPPLAITAGLGLQYALLIVRPDGDAADLEFLATTDETNVEDQLAMLSEAAASLPVEAETALRLLRHYASSIRHQQYHDIDILTIRVEPVQRSGG